MNSEDSMVGTVIFQLTGLSFTTIVGDHLFVWGDILLYRFVSKARNGLSCKPIL